ncbi:MAG: oxidoreductase [Flavobacteriales bacterium TMED235]|nr:MAG: oxidoreductase [Flavobacteriales bacterium TMED235]|tara:strand:+ start:314 stop:1252 length:939 start_codon:yes stop_codon:yes gene_type:complete
MKKKSRKFALIGAAGFIAPKHMAAIKQNKSELTLALDPNDSVGIIDRFFPNTFFFTKTKKFIKNLDKVDYLSICSPNHLHFDHIKIGLKNNLNVICEKPLVLNKGQILKLEKLEKKIKKKIYVIMQLRYHKPFLNLKKKLKKNKNKNNVEVTYIASRGNWYQTSWKGNSQKSGGIINNIGIHIFDILVWLFGKLINCEVHILKNDVAAGKLFFKNTEVKWFLSTNSKYLPNEFIKKNIPSLRSMRFNNEKIEFSKGIANLHDNCYKDFIKNKGYRLNDYKKCFELVSQIKKCKTRTNSVNHHPYLEKIIYGK